jgi:hypothetical protein
VESPTWEDLAVSGGHWDLALVILTWRQELGWEQPLCPEQILRLCPLP